MLFLALKKVPMVTPKYTPKITSGLKANMSIVRKNHNCPEAGKQLD